MPRMRSGRVGVVSLDSRRLIDDPDAQMAKGFNSAVIVPLGAGGGDFGLMKSFVEAVAHQDPARILSGPDETLESHLIVFAAELARRENRVLDIA